MRKTLVLRKARFSIDALEGQIFDGFTAGGNWNGFACPYFTHEQGNVVLAAFKAAGDKGARFDASRDAFIFGGIDEQWDEPEQFEGFVINGTVYYAIGAFGWCWIEEAHEFRNAHKQAVIALQAMLAVWPRDDVENYPGYLPSFDEFIADFQEIEPTKEG
jgi:hypothetical protein